MIDIIKFVIWLVQFCIKNIMKTITNFILTTLFASASLLLFGQNNTDQGSTVSKNTVVRINLLGIPAFSFEKSLGGNFTFRPEGGLGWPVITSEKNDDDKRTVKLESPVNPYLIIEGRYYYNLQKRFNKGKRTDFFSADYLAIYYRYNAYEYQAGFSDNNKDESGELWRDVQYVGAWWGLQRNLGKKQKFYINWSLGPGIKTNWKDYVDYSFTSQLGVGLQW